MKWHKKGLIYGPDGTSPWAKHTALTPTPITLKKDTIRIYAGFRDDQGVSRIGFVDVEAEDPRIVKRVSKHPALDIGGPGCFDDNGVILGDIVLRGNELWMYYVGFQKVQKAKFLAYTGLAISNDGEKFSRVKTTPILDRIDDALFIRAAHSVVQDDNGSWRAYCGVGSGWEIISGEQFPRYNIWVYLSKNGVEFSSKGIACIDVNENEYRIGRPRVYKNGNGYKMLYTKGTTERDYLPGYAKSDDGFFWKRRDDEIGINLSDNGWDSIHLCYPSVLIYKNRTYMFYNGNHMGKQGFGFAELVED